MLVNQVIVNINSEQPEELLRFYMETVGLPRHRDGNRNRTLVAGPLELVFDSHSNVSGSSVQPERMLINFFVDSVRAEQARIEGCGVTFIRSAGREEWGG